MKWLDEKGEEITEIWNYTENKVFRAYYTPNEYKINYVLNGGTNNPNNPSLYTIEDSITLINPYKEGYTFKGWYTDSEFKNKITSITHKTDDYILYAKFEVNNYNGSLDLEGGIIAPTVTFVGDDEILDEYYFTAESNLKSYYPPIKEGYVFAGWYIDENYQTLFSFSNTITKDTILYAKWIVTDLKTHRINSNETEIEVINVNGSTESKITFVPISSGYITIYSISDMDLKGILYNSSMNIITESDDIDEENLNFSIRYYVNAGTQYIISVKGATSLTKGECEVVFAFEGDLGISGTTYDSYSIIATYDSPFELPTPTKDGYEFVGWVDDDGNIVDQNCWKYSSNIMIYATWKIVE